MAGNGAVSLFVPVLVLVVVEISQAAREYDLLRIARRKQEPFFYSLFFALHRSSQQLVPIPQLGPFNFVHGMNLGILYLGFATTVTVGRGTTELITCLILWIVWVFFPVLEVDAYVEIMDDPRIGPRSFLFHSVVSTIAALYLFYVASLIPPAPTWDQGVAVAPFIAVAVLVFYVDLWGFLVLLEDELETATALRAVV